MSTNIRLARWGRAALAATAALAVCVSRPLPATADATFEKQVVALVNDARAEIDASPLIVENRLTNAAEEHAQWMADNDDLDHCRGTGTGCGGSPTAGNAGDRAGLAGYSWYTWGEVLAAGHPTPDNVVNGFVCDSNCGGPCIDGYCDGWRQSSGHWNILMGTAYRDIGVGYVFDSSPPNFPHWWAATLANSTSDPEPLARDISTGAEGVSSIVAADIDGDGDQDLVAAFADIDTVVWYDNDGTSTPTFTERVISSSADGARSVYATDMDRDGDVDVLAALELSDSIVWYENSGTVPPTWSTNTIDSTAYNAKLVAAGDPDHDGDIDVLAGYYDDNTTNAGYLVWYEYDGTTPWFERTVFSTADFDPHSAYVADMNGDGLLDAISASYSTGEDQIRLHRQTTVWNFAAASITSGADRPESVVVADINRDGLPDVVSASYDDDTIAWYQNGGGSTPTWTTRSISTTADGARSVHVGDVDSDGDLDVAIASELDDDVVWHVNNGASPPVWSATTISSVADGAGVTLATDLDGDGDTDVVSGSDGDDRVTWYQSLQIHRSGLFPQSSAITSGFDGARSVHYSDFDSDGNIDVVGAAATDGEITWWESQLDGTSCPPTCWSEHNVDAVLGWQAAHGADVDGDGSPDVVGAAPASDSIHWWENTGACSGTGGACTGWTERTVTSSFVGAYSVDTADIDGDGNVDVVGAASNGDPAEADVAYWLSDGGTPPVWTQTIIDDDFEGARAARPADVDGDGDTDIVAAASVDNSIVWWENRLADTCPPTCWSAHAVDTTYSGANDTGAADVDGDGDIDILGAGAGSDEITWWENSNGAGTVWVEHLVAGSIADAWSVAAGDLDSDGDLDVIGISNFSDSVYWWQNTGPCNGVGGACTSWIVSTVADSFVEPWAALPVDLDNDGQLDIVAAADDDQEVAWWENRGGQFTYATSNTAPQNFLNGTTDDVLRIDAMHLGRTGDTDEELASFDLLFEEIPGDPLTSGEANAVIEELHIYFDEDDSGAFEIANDTLVTTLSSLTLAGGVQIVTIADGDGDARLQHGTDRTYFMVLTLTSDAGSQNPNMFQVTHVTEASSTMQNRETDENLGMEFTANVASSTTPITLAHFRAQRSAEGVTLEWSTLTEAANVGFNVYERSDGRWRLLNQKLIPSQSYDSLEPRHYRFVAAGARGDEFLLEDVDALSRTRKHGPFGLDEPFGAVPDPVLIDWAAVRDEHELKMQSQIGDALVRLRTELEAAAPGLSADHAAVAGGPPPRAGSAGTGEDDLVLPNSASRVVGMAVRWPVAELKVSEEGIYRVRYEDLLDAGIDVGGLPRDAARVTHRGQPVPLRLPSGRTAVPLFGPGEWIEFYGRSADTLYADTSVYVLEFVPGGGPLMPVDDSVPDESADPPSFYMETAAVEHDREYSFGSPNGDPWYAASLLAYDEPVSWADVVPVSDLARGEGDITLDIGLWGMTNWPDSPDHHIQVEVNDRSVTESWFDGLVDHPVSVEVPTELIKNGENQVRLVAPGDTGAAWDLIAIDKLSMAYPRRPIARNGELAFESSGQVLAVSGLPSDEAIVYRLLSGGPVHVKNVRVDEEGASYRALFPGTPSTARYIASDPGRIRTPAIGPSQNVDLLTGEPAEYLVVSHPDFIPGLAPLLRARREQGLSVRVVNVEDVYRQFSGGEVDPNAIRQFVRHSYNESGTRYLLLVGGDTYDYRDNLNLGSVSFVPSLYAPTGRIVQYAPVDPLYGEITGDLVPDLAVGRLPVRSADELSVLIKKTLAYAGKDYSRTAVFTADVADPHVSFTADSEDFAATLPASWSINRIYLDRDVTSVARRALLDIINNGVALTSFVGHSGPTSWSSGNLFDTGAAATLSNEGRPTVVVQWGCWNTYYVAPKYDTLGHALLLSGDRGAAAVLGAATLTQSTSEEALGEHISGRLVTPGGRVGDAITTGKEALARTQPELADVLLGWTLLGDPALVVEPFAP